MHKVEAFPPPFIISFIKKEMLMNETLFRKTFPNCLFSQIYTVSHFKPNKILVQNINFNDIEDSNKDNIFSGFTLLLWDAKTFREIW